MWRAFMAQKAQKGTNVNLNMIIQFSSGVSFVTKNAINVSAYVCIHLLLNCTLNVFGLDMVLCQTKYNRQMFTTIANAYLAKVSQQIVDCSQFRFEILLDFIVKLVQRNS